jgi:hypothetical protein
MNMKSHTGGCLFFGKGAIIGKSNKQKLNTKSSTEAELVGCSDYIPYAIYTRLFLQKQGYDIKPSVVLQDNQSTIKLLKNGKASASKKSRHIDIRYFFMKDRIEKEEFAVEYCPTEHMVADFFTKPLQGNLFRRMSAVVMGEIDMNTFVKQCTNMEPKERVEVTVSPTENEQNDDVKLQVDYHDISSNDEHDDSNKRSYADVISGRR